MSWTNAGASFLPANPSYQWLDPAPAGSDALPPSISLLLTPNGAVGSREITPCISSHLRARLNLVATIRAQAFQGSVVIAWRTDVSFRAFVVSHGGEDVGLAGARTTFLKLRLPRSRMPL